MKVSKTSRHISHRVTLGLDLGTSKISVAYFSETTKDWRPLLVIPGVAISPDKYFNYVEPSKITMVPEYGEAPFFGREAEEKMNERNAVVLESIKKCVFCEWFQQVGVKEIVKDRCRNRKNFDNADWCKNGSLDFTIGDYEWKPGLLLQQLMHYAFNKAREGLERLYKDLYIITELKLAFPMIFHEGGPEYEGRLLSLVKYMAKAALGSRISEKCEFMVVEEPIASLMGHCGDAVGETLSDGYFMIIDVGAGSTDFALCEKTGKGISLVRQDSFLTAGDDYDDGLREVMQMKLGGQVFEEVRARDIRQAKEDYCGLQASVVVPYKRKGEDRIREVQLEPSEIEAMFAKINKRIGERFRNIRNFVRETSRDLREIYLSGGGTNVPSLRSELEGIANEGREDPIPMKSMVLIDKEARGRFDAKIVGASMGAAFPRRKYAQILKYVLPVNILVKYSSLEGDDKEIAIYTSGVSDYRGRVRISDIKEDSRMRLLVEKRQGQREILTSFNTPQARSKGKRKPSLHVSVEYEVEFNGKISVKYTPSSTRRQQEVYYSYPHWKF